MKGVAESASLVVVAVVVAAAAVLIALAMFVEMVAVTEHSQRVLKAVIGIGRVVGVAVRMRMIGRPRSFVVNEAATERRVVSKYTRRNNSRKKTERFSEH